MSLSHSVQQLRETWQHLKNDFSSVKEDMREEYPDLSKTAQKICDWIADYADLLLLANLLTAVYTAPWYVAAGAAGGIMSASFGPLALKVQQNQALLTLGDFMSSPAKQGWTSLALLISRLFLKTSVTAATSGYLIADFAINEARRLTWERG